MSHEIWTSGKQGCVACINMIISRNIIIATSEGKYITQHQMRRALKCEFPQHTFSFAPYTHFLRADALRFPDDGV